MCTRPRKGFPMSEPVLFAALAVGGWTILIMREFSRGKFRQFDLKANGWNFLVQLRCRK